MPKRPPTVTVVDFETDPIEPRPDYPPQPVGVSIKRPGKKARYFAWGHHSGQNNCSKRDATNALRDVWRTDNLLFHNAKFDIDVAQTHMGVGAISWERVHDSMFLLFLHDPHAPDFKLKPSSERLLSLPPDEKDAVEEWLWAHRKQLVAEFPELVGPRWVNKNGNPIFNSRANMGAFIAYAPGDIAGAYANGDTDRTEALFKYLYPRIAERGMEEAYDRERQLMPILLDNERVGIRVDLRSLRKDIKLYGTAVETADEWLRKRLKDPHLNLDNDGQVAEALARLKIIAEEDWTLTATGNRSVSKKNLLPSMYKDPRVAAAFGYRNRLQTCLKMFMLPWERQASARPDRHVSTNWNQIRNSSGGDISGTRTGRPSTSNPNFLNISKSWYDKDDGYEHPNHITSLPDLPLVRKYILPDDGDIFCHRDYNGQELRLLGHFEDDALMRAYQENPRMDVHDHVRQLLEDIAGLRYHRTQVKITNFRRIYGGGAPATAGALHIDISTAKQLLAGHSKALPGVKQLSDQIKRVVADGDPIVTWGGREYYPEEPKYDKRFGRMMTYEYKLLNYLIQGSAADCTKEAILRWHNHPKRVGRFLVTVYDEINISVPKDKVKQGMGVLGEAMESIETDVPMLTDGKTGLNWAALKKWEE